MQKEIEILKVFEEKRSFWNVKEKIGGQNPELRRGWVRTDEEKTQQENLRVPISLEAKRANCHKPNIKHVLPEKSTKVYK